MCQEINPGPSPALAEPKRLNIMELDELTAYARFVAEQPEIRRIAVGFVGFGATRPGDKVLFVVHSHYDPQVVEAVARALREKGAKVDIITVDAGEDRDIDELDEIRAIIRRKPFTVEPRRYEGLPWIEELAQKNKYDLLIHGNAYNPPTRYRYEGFPWLSKEQFVSKATVFPRDIHTLICHKAWALIWEKGKGGKVHLTDPEGTDVTYTLWEEYYDLAQRPKRTPFNPTPLWGHLMGHPSSPIIAKEDAAGVIMGTTGHFERPFPQVKIHLEGGHIRKIEGGGKYGEAWRELWEETKNIQYPAFPGPGLFWLWEVAIGTNVKICRPSTIRKLSSGGTEWERQRSGIVHMGMGTSWRYPEEVWAGEQGFAYGHLHVHLLFPTLEVTTKAGEKVTVINKGRLTALDDPEVRKLASKYGDPDELLKEDWIPRIPGINAEGKYEDFAKDPASYIYGRQA